jgi:hypothetical protein
MIFGQCVFRSILMGISITLLLTTSAKHPSTLPFY